jgi:hypothetical protein
MRETAHADDQLNLRGLEHPIVNGSLKWILQAMFRQRKPDSIHTTLDLHSADQMLDDSVWVISTFIKNDALVLERKSQREECP